MITREELLKTEEYWYEIIQNEIYRLVSDYIRKSGITKTQFAEHLGVSKGYVSQILNGNFNATLRKIIELSLSVNTAPVFSFKDLEEYIKEDHIERYEMLYDPHFSLHTYENRVPLVSGSFFDLMDVKPEIIELVKSEAA